MTPADDLAHRVTELEIQLELRSSLVHELNAAVIQQAQELAVLRRELDELKTQAAAGSSDDRPDPTEEPPPPHY